MKTIKLFFIASVIFSYASCSETNFAEKGRTVKEKPMPTKQSQDSRKKDTTIESEGDVVKTSSTKSDEPEETLIDEDEVIVAALDRNDCGGPSEKQKIIRIEFPAVRGCPMGLEGNPDRKLSGEVVSATRTQTEFISLDENAILCSLEFDGGSNDFQFDDYLFFTIEDYIFATTVYQATDFLAKGMTEENGLIRYEKEKLIGTGPYATWMEKDGLYICPSFGSCTMPISEKSGQTLSISAPKEHFDAYPDDFFNNNNIRFSAHVTGGRADFSNDCSHTGINFDVKVNYLQ